MKSIAQFLTHGGIALVIVGLSKAHATLNDYDYTDSFRFGFSMGLIAVLGLSAYAFGLPDLARSFREGFVAAIKATFMATLLISAGQLLLGDDLLPRFVVLGSPLILVPWLALCSVGASTGSRRAGRRARVFLVACEENRVTLARDLDLEPERPALLIDSMTPEEVSLDSGESFSRRVMESGATMLVLDRTALLEENVVSAAGRLHLQGLRVRTIVAFYEGWLGKLPITELERASLMFDISELHRVRYGRVKRLMDILTSSVGLVVLIVVFPLVYLGNLLSGNPRFIYRQPRVGKNGREFLMYKFPTMAVETGIDRSPWTSLDDPRITRFGRLLRKAHLDELPQVVNILKGELSLVGPRPEQPHYVESLSKILPYYTLRYSVTPGLTGWAQVKYGYAGNDADARQKLQYDFYYLSHQSLRLDLLTLGRTVRSIVGMKGR